ncbi:hypothetical protein LTR37_005406 [Vermiconidia calcicola]|uniref:Uncharacterized protein n=1 Tax=Vermiconidia calcicola TaxID=1690605 RepID=A0ACC3NJI8_9PEZI|nr:hypothetical protein LTR37_005406 [Vermiconidia calcicola]
MPPDNSAMTAPAAVFETVELLEAILYKLPVKDLLFAQHVAKLWRDIIKNSNKLQQALFLVPVNGLYRAYRNPLLKPLFDILKANGMNGFYTATSDPLLSTLELAWFEPTASWRSMLLTQPPTSFEFEIGESVPGTGTVSVHACGTSKDPAGKIFMHLARTWDAITSPPKNRKWIVNAGDHSCFEPLKTGQQLEARASSLV